MRELKPCPFCGKEVILQEIPYYKEIMHYVVCCQHIDCPKKYGLVEVASDTKEGAINGWNTRHQPLDVEGLHFEEWFEEHWMNYVVHHNTTMDGIDLFRAEGSDINRMVTDFIKSKFQVSTPGADNKEVAVCCYKTCNEPVWLNGLCRHHLSQADY